MKKLLIFATAAIAAIALHAKQLMVLNYEINEGSSKGEGTRFLNWVENNPIDFAVVDYAKGTTSTYFTGAGNFARGGVTYTVSYINAASNNNKAFVYDSAKYRLLASGNSTDTFFVVYEDVLTGEQYLMVSVRINATTYSNTPKKVNDLLVGLNTYINGLVATYPSARLLVSRSSREQTMVYPGSAGSIYDGKTFAEITDEYLQSADGPALTKIYTDSGSQFYVNSNSMPSAYVISTVRPDGAYYDSTLAAVTYPTLHRVIFEDYDGTGLQTNVVLEGSSVIPPTLPERPGFTFAGWDHTASEFENVTSSFTAIAQYEAAVGSVIVTFLGEDSSVLSTESVQTGETVDPIEAPAKTGCSFYAWLKDNEPYDFDTPVTEAFDLTVAYTVNVFRVTFQYDDGEEIVTRQVNYNEDAVAPANPEPKSQAQIFWKWNRTFTSVTEDIVVTAEFLDKHLYVGTESEFLTYIAAGLPPDASLTMTNDLDFTGMEYTSANFAATLNGNGYGITGISQAPLFDTVSGTVRDLTISNCVWNKQAGAYFLADTLSGALIENCTVENCSVPSSSYKFNTGIGGIAGYACTNEVGRGTVLSNCVARNCLFTYPETAGIVIGGIVRTAKKGTLFVDCAFETDDTESVVLGGRVASVGGIAGETICATLQRCRNNGKVKAGYVNGDSAAGGIVGRCATDNNNIATAPSVFIDCENSADVVNVGRDGGAGGIVGRSEKTYIRFADCVNRGNVSMECFESYEAYSSHGSGCGAGGILGGIYYAVTLTMEGCVNWGSVSADYARSAGGLAGGVNANNEGSDLRTAVTNSVNHGPVVGGYAAGGIFGMYSGIVDANLLNCANTGDVNCPTGHVGGVCGYATAVRMNNNKEFELTGVKNVMNSGSVATESGFAGGFVGTFVGSRAVDGKGNYYTIAPTNLVLRTEVTAGENGVASNLIANIVLQGRDVTIADADTHYLASVAFKNRQAKSILNRWVKAQNVDYPKWVQTNEWPDLNLFSEGILCLLIVK